MLLLLWPGARVALSEATRHVGSRIVGGTFSRGRWRSIQEEQARVIREAAERKRRKRKKEQEERERRAAFEAALLADAARNQAELDRLNAWASLYAQAANDVGAGADSIAGQAKLSALMLQNSRRLAEERNELELIEALFAA